MFPIDVRTERLRIREYSSRDASAVLAARDDDDGALFAPAGTLPDLKSVEQWLDDVAAEARMTDRHYYRLAVASRDDDIPFGIARVSVDVPSDNYGSIGYAIARKEWGKGYGTEVATALVCLGFDLLDLHRIDATVDPDNFRSIRVVEKLGMSLEGQMRERFRTGKGWRDAMLYSVLAPEWAARTTAARAR